ncbi:hypothetical protein ACXR2T_10235 [Leucobacter sp. HY1910]
MPETPACAYCQRPVENQGLRGCVHCSAVMTLVWDMLGGREHPAPADYQAWANSPTGGVVERRLKRHFLRGWRSTDGKLRPVPRVAD